MKTVFNGANDFTNYINTCCNVTNKRTLLKTYNVLVFSLCIYLFFNLLQ